MELSKKTTILFPPHLHARLLKLARERGTSLGNLVREACEIRYAAVSRAERIEAVREIERGDVPVGSPEELKREYVSPYKDLPGWS